MFLKKHSQPEWTPADRQRERLLLDYFAAELIEGNTWGDRIWGVCDGVGENRLGKILMRVRAEM